MCAEGVFGCPWSKVCRNGGCSLWVLLNDDQNVVTVVVFLSPSVSTLAAWGIFLEPEPGDCFLTLLCVSAF